MSYEYHREEYKGHTIIIEQDEDGMNPRTEWDNLGTMVFFHRNYTADKHDFSDTDDMVAQLSGIHIDDLETKNCTVFELGKTPQWDWRYKYKGRWITEEEVTEKQWAEVKKNYVILPVYMYDHSGVTINTGGFSCGWDSGQVGWIYCEKKKLLEETGYKKYELFDGDTKRKLKVGDYAKVRRDVMKHYFSNCKLDFEDGEMGKVVKVHHPKSLAPLYDVDFDYNNPTKKNRRVVTCIGSAVIPLTNMGEEILKGEVQTFDDYLQGNVFGYVVEKDGEEIDSCWGFYPDHEYHKDDWDYCLREARSIVDYNVEAANKSHFKQLKTWIKAKVALIYRQPLSI